MTKTKKTKWYGEGFAIAYIVSGIVMLALSLGLDSKFFVIFPSFFIGYGVRSLIWENKK